MIRRLQILLFAFFSLAAALSGCKSADEGQNRDTEGKLSVVATVFAPYDFSRQLAGDNAEVTMLVPPAVDSHSFEPTPQDVIRIQSCDLFIYTGGESDAWINDILASLDTEKMMIITLMDCVDVLEEELVEGMQAEADVEEDGDAYDEHVWTSPKNAKLIVREIANALCRIDEDNATIYKKNMESYLKALDSLDADFRKIVAGAERKTIVFGDRFPFRYFADEYGLEYYAAFPGCSGETEPSAATVTFLIDMIKAHGIPVVFHAELSNKKMAATISEATGAEVLLMHACHNISRDDFQNGVSYLDLMTENSYALKAALEKGEHN